MKFILTLSIIVCLTHLQAQNQPVKEYIVITYEDVYANSLHGLRSYYWIVDKDSLSSIKFQLSHLFVDNFSKDNITDCCNGKAIDPFVVDKHTDYKIDPQYFKKLDSLTKLLSKHRRKLQTIVKTWAIGQKETINVFATPVSGQFCFSQFRGIGQDRTGYKGMVSIPLSSFSYFEKFWELPSSRQILTRDYSDIKFKIISY